MSALSPAKWLGLSHRQAKHPRVMLTTEGRVLEEILKTKFNLRSSTEEDDEVKITQRPMNCHKIEVSNHSTSFTNLRYASGWVRLTDKQSTKENNGVDGVTYVL